MSNMKFEPGPLYMDVVLVMHAKYGKKPKDQYTIGQIKEAGLPLTVQCNGCTKKVPILDAVSITWPERPNMQLGYCKECADAAHTAWHQKK